MKDGGDDAGESNGLKKSFLNQCLNTDGEDLTVDEIRSDDGCLVSKTGNHCTQC